MAAHVNQFGEPDSGNINSAYNLPTGGPFSTENQFTDTSTRQADPLDRSRMEARKYCVYNIAKESTLSAGVTVIDTTLEPLKVLRVMIEGLAKNTDTGLWLTPLNEIPKVPRLAPFDLVYLDKDRRVIRGAELLPGIEFPAFEHSADSALVLPFKTMSSSRTGPGDQLAIEEEESSADTDVEGEVVTPAESEPASPVKASHFDLPANSGTRPVAAIAEPPALKPPRIEKSAAAFLLEKSEALSPAEAPTQAEARTGRPAAMAKTPRVLGPKQKPTVLPKSGEATRGEQKNSEQEAGETEIGSATEVEDAAERAAQQALEKAARKTAAEKPSDVFFEKPRVKPETKEGNRPSPKQVPIAKPTLIPDPIPDETVAPILDETVKGPASTAAETATPPEVQIPAGGKAQSRPPVVVGRHIEATEKQEEEEEQKVPVVTRVLRWLYPELAPPQNSRRAIRRTAPELMAYHWVDGQPHPLEIGDISSSGVYVKTEDRWQPGERISLILQRKGPLEDSPERQFLVDAGAVRWGHDGVGLAFILPPGMDVHIWEGPLKRRDDEKEPEYILREFRMSRALAFVRRICPQAVEEIDLLFHRELSNYRLSSAVEIALKAEMMLVNEPDADQLSASSEMVVRILELGSWAEGDLLHQMWAGMLATCCTIDGNDSSNALFIDLLTPLTLTHARILQAACTKATRVASPRGEVTSYPLYFTADEIMKIAGTNDISKIHRAVALMGDFGIFEKSAKSSFISATEKSKTTPTALGLQLYARCSGHRDVKG